MAPSPRAQILHRINLIQEALFSLALNPNTPADKRRNHCIANCSQLSQLIIANTLQSNNQAFLQARQNLENIRSELVQERLSIQASVQNMQQLANIFTVLIRLIRII